MPGLVDPHTPQGLGRLAARLPIWLYRARLGWLLDDPFLMLTHIGCKSSLPRRVVLEVVGHNKATGTYIIASGWGEKSDLFRNVQKTPQVVVNMGWRRFEVTAVRLSADVAERDLLDYARKHPFIPWKASSTLLRISCPNTSTMESVLTSCAAG
jgi:deazaflavin-dependent oxidoreductase (nitroreductase family)